MDIRDYNRHAWDGYVANGNTWTKPVTAEQIAEAREGRWEVVLTPQKPVPRSWFPAMEGIKILGLACGGGQQSPIFAAAGARVTVFDNSPAQLARDREVATRENLTLTTVEGDMANLSVFEDDSFDLIFNPVSNCFVPDVLPIWRECARVLRPGGTLLTGFANPALYLFDYEKSKTGTLEVRHALPYSDLTSISEEERKALQAEGEAFCFGHTLDDQIGGQLAAGLALTGFYEDSAPEEALSKFMPNYIATRAVKPA
ncbi:Class I SAM-dependent methyltransferase [Sulfidibacter corallicola]|uniref:Class I SAM-dependent methyltransferase n=1 Tax=Sulfidibacter corallicola TaxID=2818388 RepID=A0A8A4TTM2_SULCO|nr:class I SAM-dependent methyltransferase [Sulfidibacter corallicola]QTD52833.1 class I SAM-dependent methyltransferase [Sulfidibacter corallicola]